MKYIVHSIVWVFYDRMKQIYHSIVWKVDGMMNYNFFISILPFFKNII